MSGKKVLIGLVALVLLSAVVSIYIPIAVGSLVGVVYLCAKQHELGW